MLLRLRPLHRPILIPFARRTMASGSGRTYKDAIESLNTLQSNAAVLDSIRAAGVRQGQAVIDETLYYFDKLGYKPADLNALNVIHITGTKGKGSTSAFCSSLLTTLAPHAKVGLYTSPHLVAVRERIRINGRPLDEESFARYFWEVWDRFEAPAPREITSLPLRPAYFRFLTFVAYHAFLSENVDATVLEVGVGGTVDSTNLVPSPLVTGVSALGLDHVHILGKTIPEIAGNKGGIFKPGVPALTVEQPAGGEAVLEERAAELRASSFSVVKEHPEMAQIKLGLAGIHQRSNASLALALVTTFLASPRLPSAFASRASPLPDDFSSLTASLELPPVPSDPSPTVPPRRLQPPPSLPTDLLSPSPLPEIFRTGLERARWPGRCQVVDDPCDSQLRWGLDGAHTVESLQCCGAWWRDVLLQRRSRSAENDQLPRTRKVLIFNCTSGRNARELLGALVHAIRGDADIKDVAKETEPAFDQVVFCTNVTYSSGASAGDLTSLASHSADLAKLTVQHELAAGWKELTSAPDDTIHVLPSIEDAVRVARGDGKGETDVLVAGSLHLVGGLMEVAGLRHAL